MKTSTLYYIHDPMCSWCWGFTQTYEKFIEKLGDRFEVKRLLGGLAADSDEPMNDETKNMVQNAWHKIEKTIPGKKFNFDFWQLNTPQRSTYPACRAVIAARTQGEEFDAKMTRAIQTAYYQKAQNPSDVSILLELAGELGLDKTLFKKDILSSEIQDVLLYEIKFSRSIRAKSFPSLILNTHQSLFPIPIDYCDENTMLKAVDSICSKGLL